MKLGFHYHIPAAVRDDGVWTPGYLGRFVDSLADECESVTCYFHTPLERESAEMDYRIRGANVAVRSIGLHVSVPRRLLSARRLTAPLRRDRNDLDAMLIRGPSPLLPAFARAAGVLPVALLLVGHQTRGIEDLPQPRWRRLVIRGLAELNLRAQRRVVRRSLTFVNSAELHREFKGIANRIVETRTTTLSRQDFYERDDTCNGSRMHILYTGRMARGKGLLEVVDALNHLVAKGRDVVLDLVGWPDPGDPILEEVRDAAKSAGIGDRVIMHGRKSVGPELFQHYREADLYVLASRVSEGFPRTVWEAMAHSLPVVATDVGSIRDFIGGIAEIVKPGDGALLAEGIEKVLTNRDVRMRMIAAGRRAAEENTLERRAGEMMHEIRTFLEQR